MLSKQLSCPHCDGVINVMITARLDAEVISEDPIAPKDWRDGLSSKQLELVERARATGLLTAFEETVQRARGGKALPQSIERFFLIVLRTMTLKIVPRFALDQFASENRGARISYYSSEGIGVVVADGRIRRFVPSSLVTGYRPYSSSGNRVRVRLSVSEPEFQEWIHTKFGYVPRETTEFLDTMRKTSIGEFDRPRL